MSRPPADDDVAALIQLSGLVQETFARVADRHGLTPVQARLLCVLGDQPRGMAELARIFGVGKANLTGLVDRAGQRGLVERSPVPGDRRAFQVVLTDAGRRSAAAFHEDVTGELAGFLAALAPATRCDFREAAVTITHTAGHSAAWGPCRAC
ncbi:MarR family winged helix-turn-helix transcriptional regulator [Actinoplanes sp. CA-142083]|uniref:MarR family winged helix-turn-helix transcriptional regulator n=1 Tax=Actinoplanes sp. CA-142083 TaxID=3239903 RepID=UPI003D91EE62